MKSLPDILLRDLENVKGFNKGQFIEAHQMQAATSIRLHPQKGENLFADNAQVPWCSTGRYLPQRPVFTTDPLYHAGAYYVQEPSSMFLDYVLRQLLPNRSGLRVLDLCAAPGGKSTLVASLLEEDSLLVSNEVIRTRASILEENMTRWGHMNTWVTSNDPRDLGKLKSYFDVIVVDAPCSGSGLFRKDQRALDEWSDSNVQLCSQRQQRILADIWPSLKQGGILVYATCSYSQQEDEDVIDWVADTFGVDSLGVEVNAEWGITPTVSTVHGLQGYRFFPGKAKGEGFYLAALRKTDAQDEMKRPRMKSTADVKMRELSSHLLAGADWVCLQDKEGFVAVHKDHEEDYQLLNKQVYLRKTGTLLGTPVKNDWLPSHDVALSIHKHPGLQMADVDKEQALKFLKKEDCGLSDLPKGWYVVTYNGLGLGWIKALGNRVNNYLPKHWRIRMEINDTDWA